MADQDHRAGTIPQRPLGRTGAHVSALGLGGHHLGDLQTVDEAIRLVHEAVDAGITFYDNCWEYWNGRAEDWLGRALKGRRHKVFLMTKVCTQGRGADLALKMLDVAEDDLCGAKPGRALGVSPEWHGELLVGMVSIPEVRPGDTVWWHTDICHAVGDEHAGQEDASVIYIGSARLSSETEGGVSRRPLGARLRCHGLRGRFQGPRHREGPD
jgi:hypothetical protein